jgi:hypothetical protein
VRRYVGFIESASGCEGWVRLGPSGGHFQVEWDCDHRQETETITAAELRRRFPYAEALHRRIAAAQAGIDPSGV